MEHAQQALRSQQVRDRFPQVQDPARERPEGKGRRVDMARKARPAAQRTDMGRQGGIVVRRGDSRGQDQRARIGPLGGEGQPVPHAGIGKRR